MASSHIKGGSRLQRGAASSHYPALPATPPLKPYRALSLKQPWANLIRDGLKTIETRKWPTPYRGELLLCASKKPAIEPFGCAVCLVDLVDCRPMTDTDWAAACIEPYAPAFGWHLENIRPVANVPVTGALGIYTIELPDLAIGER